jgi:hypothetical protein
VGRFSVDLVAEGAIRTAVDVLVKKREVAVPLCFHGELNIPVKTILVIKKPPHLLWFLWPGDKSIINVT